MHKTSFPWNGAQATIRGLPALIRFRSIPEELMGDTTWEELLLITYYYDTDDDTRLPSATQYDAIASFESRVIDDLEKGQHGIFVFGKTYNGSLEYMCYVDDVDRVVSRVIEVSGPARLNFASVHDPSWTEFRRDLSRLGI